ncbi:tRNA (adenosine(37)-N6)-dimethylallyltransferase MiaA [bacterium]|nr:MAG: tRNA (adenosine(37)-N6)-dimethylallyltransferase MiaA [bacterium]
MEGNSNQEFLIIGPTASGKSFLSHEWAKKHDGVVISADSRQSYKMLSIGTAKPSEKMLQEVEYFNISQFFPNEKDDAVSFLNRIEKWKKQIKKPIVYAGGSTLYQQALVFGFSDIPSRNDENQAELERIENEKGLNYLFEWLQKVDLEYSRKMDGLNRHRIYRALDVFMQTNKPFSSYHEEEQKSPRIPVFQIQTDRDILKERIKKRVAEMFDDGLIAEVQFILSEGYNFDDPGMQTIGYQEWQLFLEGKKNIKEMEELIATKTWQYAKRQLTWMKKWDFAIPIVLNEANIQETINQIDSYLQSK